MTKSVASETDVPAGLDVVPMEPGTIVGSRDQQGTDGTTRTDRPGELLGTPVVSDAAADRAKTNREREETRASFTASEVDRANREELPRLGGPIDDGWEPSTAEDGAKAAAKAAKAAPIVASRATVPATRTTDAAPARAADSGISVKPGIDRG